MKRSVLFVLTTILLLCYIRYTSSAIHPTASFQSDYAEVGVPLYVSVNGYPMGTKFSYQWQVGDTVLSHSENNYTPTQQDLENFISVTVIPSASYESITISTYFSKLPVLYLSLDDEITSRDTYVDAAVTLQGNSAYSQQRFLYNGSAQIRGRGNSTWESYPKKPYRLKLDTAADLFGMGENKHWVLFANYADETLMRNKIAYDLSGALGMPYMESTWVSMVINGEYAGNYLLCEQIRIDPSRISISNLEGLANEVADALVDADVIPASLEDPLQLSLEADLSWLSTGIFDFNGIHYDLTSYVTLPNLSGGFLMEIDGYFDRPSKMLLSGQPLMFDSPTNAYTNEELMAYAETYFGAFFDALLNSDDFYSVYEGNEISYTELVDIQSLAQYILIQELFFNYDAALKSTYLYKDVEELAYMGPIWDLDWSSGRTSSNIGTEQWCSVYYTEHADETLWYSGLIQDPYFLSVLKELWDTHYEEICALIVPDGTLVQTYQYLYESGKANSSTWFYQFGFETGYELFFSWMTQRIQWLSQQFSSLDTLITSVGAYTPDASISILEKDNTFYVSAPEGVTAVFHLNSIRQTSVLLQQGSAAWSLPEGYTPAPSDVLTVYVYDAEGQLIGSNYTLVQEDQMP